MECYKEFKVRMDLVKCQRYKTFQPELPTKKFMVSDETEIIHNLNLLCDDSNELNKATIFQGEEEIPSTTDDGIPSSTGDGIPSSTGDGIPLSTEDGIPLSTEGEIPLSTEDGIPLSTDDGIPEQEQQPEEVEEVRKSRTGMFRDNIRRIDLVLVVEDDVNEFVNNIKMDFLSYIVKAGLEVEIEPGVMKIHEKLTFIKIHIPESVLETYGKFFGTKRYFADTRYDYMDGTMKYDKDWVMLVRKNYEKPYGYSNYERSIIVYKILLHLSFGENANYYGIERLLNRKVILDVFALHDGPYFITPDQTISGSNARQILNYYWSRIQNLFRKQPIHLIHEYFGPNLAFYFAFYEFFTKALKVAAFLGIVHTILGTLNLTMFEKDVTKSICESTDKLCESCEEGCPKRNVKDYCLSVKIHLILDHLLIPLYSLFTVVGSFIFVRLWQRREFFLKWIWEVGRHDSYCNNAVRPLFDNWFGLRKNLFIGGLKYSESVIPIFIRNVLSKMIIILYWYAIVPLMYYDSRLYKRFSKNMETKSHTKMYRDYIVMSMFQTCHILLMTVIEKIYHYIVYFIVKCENHSSHKKFSKSIVIKEIGFKMIHQYALIAYYAWLYAVKLRYQRCRVVDISTPLSTLVYLFNTLYGYKMDNICDKYSYCFPYSCIIEVATLLATLLIVTQVVFKMFDYIFFLRTDYNQSKYRNLDIPCWEREYRLSSWTEEDMVLKYVNLAAQFSLVTWFVIAFPLGPLILYIMNVWNLRHEARKLLLASRRPLFIKTPGIQMTNIFYFIASVAVLTNAINIPTITRTGIRYMMNKMGKKQDELFKFVNFYYTNYKCYTPDFLIGYGDILFQFYDVKDTGYRPEFGMVVVYGFYFCILFVLAMGCLIILICYIIPLQLEVEAVRATEAKIVNLYNHYEYKYKKSKKR